MKWIDSHTHINMLDRQDLPASIERALSAGVYKMVVPGVDSSTMEEVWDLCLEYADICYPAIGLHPTDVKENFRAELKIIEQHLGSRKYVAIGEAGLDYYWDKTFVKEQDIVLEQQLGWAKETGLPIIFHVRNAFEETMKLLKSQQNGNLQGVFHCFSGSAEQAQRVVDLGFKIGVGGVLTFKNSGLVEAIKEVDLSDVLVETDAPFLAPSPYRGKPNESSYIPLIGEKLAEVKGCAVEEIARVCTDNTRRLFRI